MSDSITTLLADAADDVIAQIPDLSADDLAAALEAERSGKKRKTVIEALEKYLSELTAAKPDAPVTDEDAEQAEIKPAKKTTGPVDMLGRSLVKTQS